MMWTKLFHLIAVIVLLIVCSGCAAAQAGQTITPPIVTPLGEQAHGNLRFDGIYLLKSTDYSYYLRFFDDGSVLTASLPDAFSEIDAWRYLSKAYPIDSDLRNQRLSQGTYLLNGPVLKFTASSPDGAVDYSGTINGNEIKFDVYSHINDRQFSETYSFFAVLPGTLEVLQPAQTQPAVELIPSEIPIKPGELDKVWKAFDAKDYSSAIKLSQEIIDKWESAALKQQLGISQEPVLGSVSEADKQIVLANWALNDVGTAYFIKGSALQNQGSLAEAKEAYEKAQALVSARTWDPDQQIFWAPADQALKNISVMNGDESEPPDTENKKLDAWMAQNQFDQAKKELSRLGRLGLFPFSTELFYRTFKEIILEDRWAMTLPVGDERTQRMTHAA